MKFITTFALAFLVSAFTYAQGGHLHGGNSIDGNNQAHAMQCGMMDKMSHEQKMAMQQRMKKMKLTMKKIQSEKDVKKREVLMQEQMADMQACMSMMEKMMGESPMGHEHKGS
ncbi:hypothetical protein NBRC116494_15950 [Aurantivibrio plasticivorans]